MYKGVCPLPSRALLAFLALLRRAMLFGESCSSGIFFFCLGGDCDLLVGFFAILVCLFMMVVEVSCSSSMGNAFFWMASIFSDVDACAGVCLGGIMSGIPGGTSESLPACNEFN